MELALAIAAAALAAWDVGRRYLARERAADAEATSTRLAELERRLGALQSAHEAVAAQVQTLRPEPRQRRAPHLSGIGS